MTALTILPQGRVRCGEQGFIPLDQTTQLMQYETVISAPIVASDAAAGMFAWQNTSTMPFLVTGAVLVVNVAPTVGNVNIDVGIASSRASSATLMAPATVTTGFFASQQPRTVTVASVNQLVAPGQWVTVSRALGATAGLAGWFFLKGIYLGTVDDASLGQGAGLCPTGRVGVPDLKGFMSYASTTGYPCSLFMIEAPLSLGTSNGGAFAWQNPFPFQVAVDDCTINVITASAAACQISVGITTAPNLLASGLHTSLSIATIATAASSLPIGTAAGVASVVIPAGGWVTGTYVSGSNVGFVGRIKLSVLPMGTVIN